MRKGISAIVLAVLQVMRASARFDEVELRFVSNRAMCKLHQEFFDDPSPTDCISFPIDSADDIGYRLLGEVVVCPKTAITYADKYQNDPYEEVTLYIIHGLLHLLGYDDLEEKTRKQMRLLEKKCFAVLKKQNLVLSGRKTIEKPR
jgi:probable rRNA maturation factor